MSKKSTTAAKAVTAAAKALESSTFDETFAKFQEVCEDIRNESSHLKKSAVLVTYLDELRKKVKINVDEHIYLFLKLALPSTDTTRVYNLSNKQLIKLCANIFGASADAMTAHFNQEGEVADTCAHFFAKAASKPSGGKCRPASRSTLHLHQVDDYLSKLSATSKESDQCDLLDEIARQCTADDWRMFVRLVKKDLHMDAGEKIVLNALSPTAYQSFQMSRNLRDIVQRTSLSMTAAPASATTSTKAAGKAAKAGGGSGGLEVMTPVKPMLAEACKSMEQAFKKCQRLLVEIKYDGERLQLHKSGTKFAYYSRSLKQVDKNKVELMKEYVTRAFPNVDTLVLDGEIVLFDCKTNKPLPFGTLGVHKRNQFKEATVCLFVFDCLYLNGRDLTSEPLEKRRELLDKHIVSIPGRVMLSDLKTITKPEELRPLIMKAIAEGLEGLVLKDASGKYEPGKRHWLKMKKDYLDEGKMADTADLVVLGAYYGTGKKSGMKSVFLMGVRDEQSNRWHTVTKVANGFDDKTLIAIQKQIAMKPIEKKRSLVPHWLDVHHTLVPDFVVKSARESPVWEITGASFSESDTHTAAGISIRFPRVTRVRSDKTWSEATTLAQLKKLFEASKQTMEKVDEEEEEEEEGEEEENAKVKSTKEATKATSNKKPQKRSSSSDGEEDEDEDDGEDGDENDEKDHSTSKKKRLEKESSDDDPSTSEEEELNFPSIFRRRTFFITDKCTDKSGLRRYIIAYGGSVVNDEAKKAEATDIVVNSTNEKTDAEESEAVSPNKTKKRVNVVTEENVWRCIKKRKLINF